MSRRMGSTLKLPSVWKQNFAASSLRTGFHIHLTQGMLEFLCACADGVQWDRAKYFQQGMRDHWMTSEVALTKRGLIERKTEAEREPPPNNEQLKAGALWPTPCKLTPAGELIVELVKMAGLFIEADDAIAKKVRKA